MDIIIIICPLLIGWLLDICFGDPQQLPHPVVWFGKAISFFEHKLNKSFHQRLKGGITAVMLIIGVYLLTWWLLKMTAEFSIWLNVGLQIVFVFFCLAGTTLIREVKMVFYATEVSVEAGRRQVGRIVGRDTACLSAQEIRTAALETLAENLSDGVVAPMFWYALLGVPGMMAYKMINTLDSMIGYRNERYRNFGMVAAKIDDVANYVPARLTAWLMILVAGGKSKLFSFVSHFGRQHASPNSGYPEAALAGILDCRFGGTHDYFGESVYKPYIGVTERDFTYSDVNRAVLINRKTEFCMLLFTLFVRYLILL